MTAMLEVDGLHVRRGGRVVNDRIAFATAPNQVLAIVGPNGAGKTTLLDAIAGLVPASGSVRFRGLELHGLRDRARVISYMPDDLVLPEEMSISRSLGLTSDAANVAVLGVAALLDRRGNALSRGEAKRCQLAAALAMPRPVVLLDEPIGAQFLDGVKDFAFFPLAVATQDPPTGNLRLSIKFYPIAGRIDQGAGIAFGITPDGSYWGVRANALEDNLLYFRVVKGKRSVLDVVRNTPTPTHTWHTLVVTLKGRELDVDLDGTHRFHKTLDVVPSGRVALWSKADSHVLFDEFLVQPI